MRRFVIPGIFLVLVSIHGADVVAQPDRTAFAIAPLMQRAYQAEAARNWSEVLRVTERVLGMADQNTEARQMRIRALLEYGRFAEAETESHLLPDALQQTTLREVRQQWVERSQPAAGDFARWHAETEDGQWLVWVSNAAFQIEQDNNTQATTDFLQSLLQLTDDWRVARLLTTYMAGAGMAGAGDLATQRDALLLLQRNDGLGEIEAEQLGQVLASLGQVDEARDLLALEPGQPWQASLRRGLLERLIFLAEYTAAKTIILAEWSLGELPDAMRDQLIELAILTEDTTLMAQPDLRPAGQCLDSVAWIAAREPDTAGELLTHCDRTLDEQRWAYLASLYNPALLPPSIATGFSEEQLEEQRVEQAAAEARLQREQETQRVAQRLQDTLDAAYQGACVLPTDAELDVIREEVNAICLSQNLPGAASVYFERVLRNTGNPRRQQLLREAAYNAYQAGDYDLGIAYWQQVTDPLTADEQAALAATEAARAASADAVPDGSDVQGVTMTLDELRSAAAEAPRLYGLELGLRLSGHEQQAQRESAIPWLEAAARQDIHDFRITETLAYRYAERGDPAAAMVSARRAIDGMDTSLAVGDASPAQLVEREFALRRTHQFLSQRNRLYVGAAWSRFGALDAIGAEPADSAFQIVSFEHLLGEHPTIAGRQLGVYARVLGSSDSRTRYFDNPAWGLGLRWKPLGEQNLNLFAELFQPDNGRTDLMLRASTSLLDGAQLRDDWRPLENRWHWQTLYLDAAWFARADDYQLYGSYTRGLAFKLSDHTPHTVSPYLSAASGHSRSFSDTSAGAGLRYRFWFSEDTYNAWRNRVDVRLEVNRSVAGDRKNSNGWRLQTEWLL